MSVLKDSIALVGLNTTSSALMAHIVLKVPINPFNVLVAPSVLGFQRMEISQWLVIFVAEANTPQRNNQASALTAHQAMYA